MALGMKRGKINGHEGREKIKMAHGMKRKK